MSNEGDSGGEGKVELGPAAAATVMAYHQLALDADKRLHLALDDTCLQFLSLVIGNGDNSFVTKALDTLFALAESPECRAPMADTFGVLHCLKAAVEEENEHTEEMKSKAAELFTCLNFALHQQRSARRRSKMPPPRQSPGPTKSGGGDGGSARVADGSSKQSATDDADASSFPQHNKRQSKASNGNAGVDGVAKSASKDDKDTDRGASLVRSDSVESNCSSVSLSSCSQPSQTQATSTSKKEERGCRNKYYRDPKHRTRMITLHIRGMLTPSERSSVEGALVRVRGVISLVFDMSRSRVACRVRRVLDLSKLGTAVDSLNMGMMLYQVVAKNKGEEIEIPLSKPTPSVAGESPGGGNEGKESDTEQQSLPDYLSEDEDDDQCKVEDDPSTTVATSGIALKEAASSLFSAAASLLQQSFYW